MLTLITYLIFKTSVLFTEEDADKYNTYSEFSMPVLIDSVNIGQLHYVHFDSAIVVYSEPSISRICSVFRQTISTFFVETSNVWLWGRKNLLGQVG